MQLPSPISPTTHFSWQYQRKGWWWHRLHSALDLPSWHDRDMDGLPSVCLEQRCTLGVPSHQGAQSLKAWTFPPRSVLCVLSHLVMSDSCNPMNYSPPVFSVRGIFQARILEWAAISYCSLPQWWWSKRYSGSWLRTSILSRWILSSCLEGRGDGLVAKLC